MRGSPRFGQTFADLVTTAPLAPEPGRDGSLRLVRELCEAIDRAGISYCHWKSTDMIHLSAMGENDLDLLIATKDLGRFDAVLEALGCWKEVVATGSAQMPGIRHLFGLDTDSGRLVDIHAHEWLLVGDDATKNYHLPIEAAYLRSAKREGLFPIPAPEFEFIVLIVRLMLKHGSPEAIITNRGRLSVAERHEIDHLSALIDPERLRRVLHDDIPFLDEGVLALGVQSLEPGCAVRIRLAAWRAFRSRLAPHARLPRSTDAFLQMWRRVDRRFRRVLGRPSRRRLSHGGRVLAIVGGDGAGKSTTVAELAGWLSPVAPTVTMHLGKPSRSAAWLVLRGTVRFGRALGIHPAWRGVGTLPPGEPGTWSYLWLLTGVANARDRCREAARAHALASRGAIVICDRYPIPGTLEIDGPRVDSERASEMTGLRRRLVELERAPYGRIPVPDAVVVLQVDPGIAVVRRPESDPELVRSRAEQIRSAPWREGTLIIDADASRASVSLDVRAGIWTRL